jgi:membrane-bound lytic murein transglycosylase D
MKIYVALMSLILICFFALTSYPQDTETPQDAVVSTTPQIQPEQTHAEIASPLTDTSLVFLRPDKKDLPKIQRNSSDDKNHLSIQSQNTSNLTAAISAAVEKAKTDKKVQSAIASAAVTYRQMQNAFENNDHKKAKQYFSKFTKQLNNADFDPALLFFLFDDFESALNKLSNIYEVKNSKDSLENLSKTSILLELTNQSLVEKYITIFTHGKSKERIQAAFERSTIFKNIVETQLADFDLPPELKYLPVIESLYQTGDISRAGAAGIWQIMPSRARALGLKVNYWIDERFDPEKATEAAALYLKQLYLMLNDWHLVLAAYNRGEYGLVRDMKWSNASNITEMVKRNAIPKETQNYVPQFIAVVKIANNPRKYGFNDIKYKEPLKYDKVKINSVIDLKIVAQCAQTSLEEIKKLNPALKAWCTPQGYPDFELKIPFGSKKIFLENIANVENLNPTTGFIKYKIVKGDYLGKIAAAFNTTEADIKNDNPAANAKTLKVGAILIIRPGAAYFKQ